MISFNELLVIGDALSQTVRSQIKYSINMSDENQLFDNIQFKKTYFYKELEQRTRCLKMSNTNTYRENAELALKLGAGNCDELVDVVVKES